MMDRLCGRQRKSDEINAGKSDSSSLCSLEFDIAVLREVGMQNAFFLPGKYLTIPPINLILKSNMNVRTALFGVITQRVVLISYRRFGSTYRFHLHGPEIQNPFGLITPKDGTDRLSRNVGKKLPLPAV